ncbi:hypothetical protein HZU77_011665 [Neisseriaceae bacterium TC5R-5]|nr:hypothetical protein [Neisseriaceae bacterium TC5R-5]
MLGVILLFVGIVLINNGAARLLGFDPKPTAVLNIFVGLLSVSLNIIILFKAPTAIAYYQAGTGLLFGFTYLFIALNLIFNWDTRPYGIYSLLVAIIAVPAAFVALQAGDVRFFIIWLLWSLLWLTGFIETVLQRHLGHFVSYLLLFSGVMTGLIPGFLMLIQQW